MTIPDRFQTPDGRPSLPRIGAAAAVLVLLLGAAFVGWRHVSALPDDAAFKYGDHIETTADLDARVHALGALYGVQRPTAQKDQAGFLKAAARADALSLILDHAAASQGIVISDKKARDTLQTMIRSQLGSQQAFDALLTRYGVGEGDILLEVKRQQAIGLLFQKVTKRATATPSDEDVQHYFSQHTKAFAVPEKRRIANIVVASKAAAQDLVDKARSGDFATLARAHSLDDATRSKGGDLGTVAAEDLDDAYAEAAFDAARGGVFGPVRTSHGWNVGKVISVVPGKAVPLAKVKPTVIATMRSERALAAWRSWLTTQVREADVQYADKYKPAHPDAIPDLKGLPGSDAAGGVG